MKCKKCGTENSNNTKFCTKCGSQLKQGSIGKSIAILILVVFVLYIATSIMSIAGIEISPVIKVTIPILAIIFGIPAIIIINSIKK